VWSLTYIHSVERYWFRTVHKIGPTRIPEFGDRPRARRRTPAGHEVWGRTVRKWDWTRILSMVEGRAPGGGVSPARRKRRPTIGARTGQIVLPPIETGAVVRRGPNSSDCKRPHDNCYQDTPVLKKNWRKLSVSRCIYGFEIFLGICDCDKGVISLVRGEEMLGERVTFGGNRKHLKYQNNHF
jgi:hypothetical protein